MLKRISSLLYMLMIFLFSARTSNLYERLKLNSNDDLTWVIQNLLSNIWISRFIKSRKRSVSFRSNILQIYSSNLTWKIVLWSLLSWRKRSDWTFSMMSVKISLVNLSAKLTKNVSEWWQNSSISQSGQHWEDWLAVYRIEIKLSKTAEISQSSTFRNTADFSPAIIIQFMSFCSILLIIIWQLWVQSDHKEHCEKKDCHNYLNFFTNSSKLINLFNSTHCHDEKHVINNKNNSHLLRELKAVIWKSTDQH